MKLYVTGRHSNYKTARFICTEGDQRWECETPRPRPFGHPMWEGPISSCLSILKKCVYSQDPPPWVRHAFETRDVQAGSSE